MPSAGSIAVIDSATNMVVQTIAVGGLPVRIALNSDGSTLYVANLTLKSVEFIDTATNTVTGSVSTPDSPVAIAFDAANGMVYVANQGSAPASSILVINPVTRSIVASIPYIGRVARLRVDPAAGLLYIVDPASTLISVVSVASNQVIGMLQNRTDSWPGDVAIDSTRNLLYVANTTTVSGFDPPPGSALVTVIDLSTGTISTTINLGKLIVAAGLDATRGRLYVFADRALITVDIATNTVVGSLALPVVSTGALAVSKDDSTLYISNQYSNVVSVVDLATLTPKGSVAMAAPGDVVTLPPLAAPSSGNAFPLPTIGPAALVLTGLLLVAFGRFGTGASKRA